MFLDFFGGGWKSFLLACWLLDFLLVFVDYLHLEVIQEAGVLQKRLFFRIKPIDIALNESGKQSHPTRGEQTGPFHAEAKIKAERQS